MVIEITFVNPNDNTNCNPKHLDHEHNLCELNSKLAHLNVFDPRFEVYSSARKKYLVEYYVVSGESIEFECSYPDLLPFNPQSNNKGGSRIKRDTNTTDDGIADFDDEFRRSPEIFHKINKTGKSNNKQVLKGKSHALKHLNNETSVDFLKLDITGDKTKTDKETLNKKNKKLLKQEIEEEPSIPDNQKSHLKHASSGASKLHGGQDLKVVAANGAEGGKKFYSNHPETNVTSSEKSDTEPNLPIKLQHIGMGHQLALALNDFADSLIFRVTNRKSLNMRKQSLALHGDHALASAWQYDNPAAGDKGGDIALKSRLHEARNAQNAEDSKNFFGTADREATIAGTDIDAPLDVVNENFTTFKTKLTNDTLNRIVNIFSEAHKTSGHHDLATCKVHTTTTTTAASYLPSTVCGFKRSLVMTYKSGGPSNTESDSTNDDGGSGDYKRVEVASGTNIPPIDLVYDSSLNSRDNDPDFQYYAQRRPRGGKLGNRGDTISRVITVNPREHDSLLECAYYNLYPDHENNQTCVCSETGRQMVILKVLPEPLVPTFIESSMELLAYRPLYLINFRCRIPRALPPVRLTMRIEFDDGTYDVIMEYFVVDMRYIAKIHEFVVPYEISRDEMRNFTYTCYWNYENHPTLMVNSLTLSHESFTEYMEASGINLYLIDILKGDDFYSEGNEPDGEHIQTKVYMGQRLKLLCNPSTIGNPEDYEYSWYFENSFLSSGQIVSLKITQEYEGIIHCQGKLMNVAEMTGKYQVYKSKAIKLNIQFEVSETSQPTLQPLPEIEASPKANKRKGKKSKNKKWNKKDELPEPEVRVVYPELDKGEPESGMESGEGDKVGGNDKLDVFRTILDIPEKSNKSLVVIEVTKGGDSRKDDSLMPPTNFHSLKTLNANMRGMVMALALHGNSLLASSLDGDLGTGQPLEAGNFEGLKSSKSCSSKIRRDMDDYDNNYVANMEEMCDVRAQPNGNNNQPSEIREGDQIQEKTHKLKFAYAAALGLSKRGSPGSVSTTFIDTPCFNDQECRVLAPGLVCEVFKCRCPFPSYWNKDRCIKSMADFIRMPSDGDDVSSDNDLSLPDTRLDGVGIKAASVKDIKRRDAASFRFSLSNWKIGLLATTGLMTVGVILILWLSAWIHILKKRPSIVSDTQGQETNFPQQPKIKCPAESISMENMGTNFTVTPVESNNTYPNYPLSYSPFEFHTTVPY